MRSLSRPQAARLLGLTPAVLDALLDDGEILCHVRGGEIRIPIEQLEAFFRDRLIRVIRAGADVVDDEPEVVMPVAAPPPPPPPPPRVSAPEPPPIIEVDEEPRDDDDEIDSRTAPRFIPRRQIDGIFGETRFSIVQMSASGLRIRHDDELIPGTEGKVSFALMTPPRSFAMRGRVVWTSVARYESSDTTFYISGVRIVEQNERLRTAIDILNGMHELQPERRAIRMDMTEEEPQADAAAAAILRVVQHFADDAVDAARFRNRARFAVADEDVRRDAPKKPREREEVLAIWEYLERQVPIAKVVEVLAGVKRSRATTSPPSTR